MKQTRQAVRAVKQSIFLDVYALIESFLCVLDHKIAKEKYIYVIVVEGFNKESLPKYINYLFFI
jgi:hypothetical protein